MSLPPPDPKRPLGRGHIYVALATGVSIVVLALVSKRVLKEEMRPLFLAVAPLLMLGYETVAARTERPWLARALTWVVAILFTTAVIVLFHLI